MNKLYWVSLIVQDKETSRPWLCAMTNSIRGLDNAIKEIEFKRNHLRVLSAWIDVFEDDVKNTVYHECYIDRM